ncbi:MAG: hypothetical protein AB7O37_14915 [Vicinamibacteria bacterium]
MSREASAAAAIGLCLVVTTALALEPPALRAASLVGVLVKVDLERSSVTVRAADGEPREYQIQVDDKTRITDSGRALGLAELRTGERIVVAYVEEGPARRRATALRQGPASLRAPERTPRPSPPIQQEGKP